MTGLLSPLGQVLTLARLLKHDLFCAAWRANGLATSPPALVRASAVPTVTSPTFEVTVRATATGPPIQSPNAIAGRSTSANGARRAVTCSPTSTTTSAARRPATRRDSRIWWASA